jgi:hypothetical protein
MNRLLEKVKGAGAAMALSIILSVHSTPAQAGGGPVAMVSLERVGAELAENSPPSVGFVVRRTWAANELLTVYFTIGGSAKNGQDYRRSPGTVTIPAGADSAMINLEPIEDNEVEGPETVTLTLVSNTVPFPLAVLLDTQYYIGAEFGGTPLMFDRQTQWIADHRDECNITFVLHEGDITEDNAANGAVMVSLLMTSACFRSIHRHA